MTIYAIMRRRWPQHFTQRMPVVELDYSSMFTRLAYGEIGATPPEGDLYLIPGLEEYRSGVKLAMNAFLFDTSNRRRSWPSAMAIGRGTDEEPMPDEEGAEEVEGRLPRGWNVRDTKDAILQVHPALRSAWARGLGYRMMFVESEILVSVWLELISRGITALGLHDGVIVARSKEKLVMEVMTETAQTKARVHIPVKVK